MLAAQRPATLSILSAASNCTGHHALEAKGCKWYGYFLTIFEFDPVWKGFIRPYPIRVSNIRNRSVSECSKVIFYDVDIHYNSIRQKLTLSVSDSVFEHKYENMISVISVHIRSVYIPTWSHLGLACVLRSRLEQGSSVLVAAALKSLICG